MREDIRNKYIELNWLRGISAILVVLFHYTVRYEEILDLTLNWSIRFKNGGKMVVVFFILSGFLGVFNLKEDETIKKYLKKRILRLYPIYWICMAFTISIMLFFFPYYRNLPDSSIEIKDILYNVTMLQGLFLKPSIDGAYWTLAIEIRFYLFVAIIILLKQNKNIDKWLKYWLRISFLIILVQKMEILNIEIYHKFITILSHIVCPKYCPVFIIGAYLALYFKNSNKKNLINLLEALLTCGLIFNFKYMLIIIITIIYILFIIFFRKEKKYLKLITVLEKKFFFIFSFIAYISYPLYLLHQHIGFAIIWNIQRRGWSNEIIIIVPIVIVLLLSFIIQKTVDRILK